MMKKALILLLVLAAVIAVGTYATASAVPPRAESPSAYTAARERR